MRNVQDQNPSRIRSLAQRHQRPHDQVTLARRLDKATGGNLGDVKPLGEGLYEMHEYFGPGWRMYYVKRGDVLIIMLGGGNKSSQRADIAIARQRSALLED